MTKPRSTRILVTYGLSLAVTVTLLVVWVIYVVRSAARLQELAHGVGVPGDKLPWVVLTVGCVLFFLLIVAVTSQLAQSLVARRYARKQEEFISNITHEMKSPLAAIKLHVQTLQQDDLQPELRQRSLGLILQQAERMGALIDNMLESSRLVAHKKTLDLEPVDLAGFFAGWTEEARLKAAGQGVLLRLQLATAARVLATPEALRRMMDNLLDNAVRFSTRGGEVRCRVRDLSNLAVIEVEDDGTGIPKTDLSKIFDRFYQSGRPTDGRRRGSGLGLSIVSGLVREMHGSVRAFSQEGRPGTRFVIELPRLEEAR